MLEFLAQIAWKVTVLWGAAWAVTMLLRRAAAATRHFVWTAALAAALLLPAAMFGPAAPALKPQAASSAVVVTVHAVAPARAATPPRPSRAPLEWPLYLWLAGCALVAARFLLGAARACWMTGCSAELPAVREQTGELSRSLGIRRSVRVLASDIVPVPMTWGLLRPVVLLPADAITWPPARRRAVLLHELVHVRRRDLLAQAIGQAACCLYWFHPLAWLAAARLRREREAACDDAVLLRGIPAHEYAGHLMELARSFAAARRAWSDAPAMAEAGGLEARVRAVLDRRRVRGPLSRRAAAVVLAGTLLCFLPLTMRTAKAQAGNGALSGAVQDPSGSFVPNCEVVAHNLDGRNEEVTHANAAGQFRFDSIPAGSYSVQFLAPGFRTLTRQVTVTAGGEARTNGMLELGNISQEITVTGTRPANGTPQVSNGTPQRIRVGGNVQASRLVSQVRPVYPFDAQEEGVQGTVRIRAIVSKTGSLLSATVLNTDIDARLSKAALDAVNQWKYEPTLLNGHPVEVITDIYVTFELN